MHLHAAGPFFSRTWQSGYSGKKKNCPTGIGRTVFEKGLLMCAATVIEPGIRWRLPDAFLGSDTEVALNRSKDFISAFARFINISGFQGKSQTFRCGVWFVDCYMAPPDTTVIPQVVIGVIVIDSKGNLGLSFHLFDLWHGTYV